MSEEYEIEVIPVVIAAEPIELYKILKIENLVTSGSEAKNLIAAGYVYVNGEIETRKRKKIMFGDIVGFDGEAYQVLSAEDLANYTLMDDVETTVETAIVSTLIAEDITLAECEEQLEIVTSKKSQHAELKDKKELKNKATLKEKNSKNADVQVKSKKNKDRAAPFSF